MAQTQQRRNQAVLRKTRKTINVNLPWLTAMSSNWKKKSKNTSNRSVAPPVPPTGDRRPNHPRRSESAVAMRRRKRLAPLPDEGSTCGIISTKEPATAGGRTNERMDGRWNSNLFTRPWYFHLFQDSPLPGDKHLGSPHIVWLAICLGGIATGSCHNLQMLRHSFVQAIRIHL